MNIHSLPASVAWIDPTGQPAEQDAAHMAELGLKVRHVQEPSQVITSLAHTHLLVVRAEHDTAMLEECLTLAQMPGRKIPVVCRVPPQQLELAVQAARLGADHVLSTLDWSAAAWAPVLQSMGGVSGSSHHGTAGSAGSGASQGGSHGSSHGSAPGARRSVVFVDPASQQLLALARKVAQTEVSALLVGPTGAGKEVLARVLHEASRRSGGPFVGLNCGALPEHLIEDLLFGHEKGAFSGAIRDHQGIFEQAQGGTVFLDEIGEMPMHLQTRLLRVLQERCITRLGGTRSIPVDVRIVAATNRDLKQAMLQREFREDLYFRISTFTLRVLPLRERPLDILPLAAHVLQQHGMPGEPYRITEEARRRLLTYTWPGNVRELGNVIQRALVLCPDRVLTHEHLLFDDDVFAAANGAQTHLMHDGGIAVADASRPWSGAAPQQAAHQQAAPHQAAPHQAAPHQAAPHQAASHALHAAAQSPRAVGADAQREVFPYSAAGPAHGLGGGAAVMGSAPAAAGAGASGAAGLQWAVRHSELQVIQDAIRNTSNREAAARLLGISPRTLRYKLAQMRDLGLLTAEFAA